jgi:hypothetical protein
MTKPNPVSFGGPIAVLVLLAFAVSDAAEPTRPVQPMPMLGWARIRSSGELEIGSARTSLVPGTYTAPVPTTNAPLTPGPGIGITPFPMNQVEEARVRVAPQDFWVYQNGSLLGREAAANALREETPVAFAKLARNQNVDAFYLQFFKPSTVVVGIARDRAERPALPSSGSAMRPPPTTDIYFPAPGPGATTAPLVPLKPRTTPAPSYQPNRPALPSSKPVVTVERIDETRSSMDFFTRLEVLLKVAGTGLDKTAGFRCRLDKAVDDTGAVIAQQNGPTDGPEGFSTYGCTLRLKLPARKATAIQELSGVVEMLLPDRDPQATVTVTGFATKPRLEVSDPALDAAGVKLVILSKAGFDRMKAAEKEPSNGSGAGQLLGQAFTKMFAGLGAMGDLNENSVIVLSDDPNGRVVTIDFLQPSGQPIPTGFSTRSGNQYTYNLPQKLPETATMRIVLATPQATVAVPFTLKDIPLP